MSESPALTQLCPSGQPLLHHRSNYTTLDLRKLYLRRTHAPPSHKEYLGSRNSRFQGRRSHWRYTCPTHIQSCQYRFQHRSSWMHLRRRPHHRNTENPQRHKSRPAADKRCRNTRNRSLSHRCEHTPAFRLDTHHLARLLRLHTFPFGCRRFLPDTDSVHRT